MPDCRKRCGGPCGRAAKKAIKRGTDPIDNVNFGAEGYTNNIISTSLGFAF